MLAFNELLESLPKTVELTTEAFRSLLSPLERLLASKPTTRRQESMADRAARISSIQITPSRYVAYIGDTLTLSALGLDSSGQAVQGAKFSWESNDADKAQVDESGSATFIHAGLASITCRAGSAQATATILIKPGRRRLQTDSEWRADQDSISSGSLTNSSNRFSIVRAGFRRAAAPVQSFYGYAEYAQAASTISIGTPPFTPQEPTRLGSVLSTSNFELAIPIVNLGGRGLTASLNLYYNSDLWGAYQGQSSTVFVFDPIESWPSPGFSLGFGRIILYNQLTDGTGQVSYDYMLIEPNGTRHNLGRGNNNTTNTLRTTDGSQITYVGNELGGNLFYKDGTKVTIELVNNRRLPTRITDTNGNYIQIAYKWEAGYAPMAINYITDTLGRIIQFNYEGVGSTKPTSISTPLGTTTLQYQTVTISQYRPWLGETIIENMPTSFSALANVSTPTFYPYQFIYSGCGMIYNISINNGAAQMSYNFPLNWDTVTLLPPTFTQRTESPNAVYTYASGGVTRPDGTKLFLSNTLQELKSSTNATLSKSVYAYTTDPGGSTAIQSVTSYDETNTPVKVDFDYDQYGNIANKREYGHQISGQWKVRRRTHYSYLHDLNPAYASSYIRDRVYLTEVFDAKENTSDADDALIAKSQVSYDGGTLEMYGGAALPPGHLPSYDSVTLRGNATGATTWKDIITNTTLSYTFNRDKFGNMVKAQTSCCDEKRYIHTGNTYWSKAEQITKVDPQGTNLTTTAVYNFNTGYMESETDPNSETSQYSYDSAGNQTGYTLSTGATGATSYNLWSKPTGSSFTYSEGGGNKTITTSNTYDAWGQMTSSVDANGAQTNYSYNNMGRLVSKTNPFPQGGQPGPVTTYQYDQLGRVTVTTLPGGNTQSMTYSGNIVTVTDQVNRKIRRQTDGLGRLMKVTEQDATGALAQETNYTYDIADRLVEVNQGGQLRKFKYDAAGNLLYELIPEQSATINDGTGVMWTCKYTYNDWNAVATRQDARGVITTYSYDSLHRMVGVSYNTSSAPGVAATPNATYTYDTNPNSGTKGLLLSVAVGTAYSESYSYDSEKRIGSVTRTIEGRNYTTSYQYNTANQMTQLTYPNNTSIALGHDSKGRLASVGSYLSNMSHNGIGQMVGTTLGNGVNETFGYDANRMQLTTQTAVKGANTLLSLTYGFQAQAGQMGAGSTAGNAGQLMSVSGTINNQTESASYTYDLLSRLVTSNQSSGGASRQRRFDYDRWGNRTSVWDALSGGQQIQLVTLQQSGGVPTNRISVLTKRVGPQTFNYNYSYDTAGNVTADEANTYVYDGENRLVSANFGSATYGYDHQNRRVKKTAGATNLHYVWEGSQVLTEHAASTGALLTSYVYAGSRMIAKQEGGNTRYFLSDRLSARVVTDASGSIVGRQAHLPFGEAFALSGENDKHYLTSYERDVETGLDYAVNRAYSPNVARFTRPDPYSCSYNTTNPQTLNRFLYSDNDPVNKNDPTGLLTSSEFLCITNPILCEDNRLPGGGPRPNPEYGPWGLFGPRRVAAFGIVNVEFGLDVATIDPLTNSIVCIYSACEKNPCGIKTFVDILPPGSACYPGIGASYDRWKFLGLFTVCSRINLIHFNYNPCPFKGPR
jgi:RHS repeat-associated protein